MFLRVCVLARPLRRGPFFFEKDRGKAWNERSENPHRSVAAFLLSLIFSPSKGVLMAIGGIGGGAHSGYIQSVGGRERVIHREQTRHGLCV